MLPFVIPPHGLSRSMVERFLHDHCNGQDRPMVDSPLLACPKSNHTWQNESREAIIAVIRGEIDHQAALLAIESYRKSCSQAQIKPFSKNKAGKRGVQSIVLGSWITLGGTAIQPVSGTDELPRKALSAEIRQIASIVCALFKRIMPASYDAMAPIEKVIYEEERCEFLELQQLLLRLQLGLEHLVPLV